MHKSNSNQKNKKIKHVSTIFSVKQLIPEIISRMVLKQTGVDLLIKVALSCVTDWLLSWSAAQM